MQLQKHVMKQKSALLSYFNYT